MMYGSDAVPDPPDVRMLDDSVVGIGVLVAVGVDVISECTPNTVSFQGPKDPL